MMAAPGGLSASAGRRLWAASEGLRGALRSAVCLRLGLAPECRPDLRAFSCDAARFSSDAAKFSSDAARFSSDAARFSSDAARFSSDAASAGSAGAGRNSPDAAARPAGSAGEAGAMTSATSAGSARSRPAFLDYQATTPLDPRVLDRMLPYQVDQFGNPHSRTHSYGWEAEKAVEAARASVARLINAASPKEVIFTSGATESNNLAIKGVAEFYRGSKKHIVTSQIEHKCVLASCRHLQDTAGFDVTYLPVSAEGLIDLEELRAAIRPDTALVSIMFVNNEIGVVQDIAAIGRICREKNVLFHSDAAQGAGKLPLDVRAADVSLLSISGHKIYGPKGVGALYIQNRRPRTRLAPLLSGGGQERGMRSGTLPTFLCVGLGAACDVAAAEMENDRRHICGLERRLIEGIERQLPAVKLNGSPTDRYKGNVNLSFTAVEGESLLMCLDNVAAVSSGSACTSASLEPSYVLRALGVGEDQAHTSLRFGLGRFTTEEEVDRCVEAVVKSVRQLRSMSPLWNEERGGAAEEKPVWT